MYLDSTVHTIIYNKIFFHVYRMYFQISTSVQAVDLYAKEQ